MMKKLVIVAIASFLTFAACHSKTQEFKAADGSVRATVTIGGDDWHITDANGNEVVTDYDSMRVVEIGEDGHPMTICYHHGDEEIWLQYYSTMVLRSRGNTRNGVREGLWTYYYANGTKQAQSTFVGGMEEGEYVVYRENGIPYYRGTYHAGQRTGTWEVYDPDGNIVETKKYE